MGYVTVLFVFPFYMAYVNFIKRDGIHIYIIIFLFIFYILILQNKILL